MRKSYLLALFIGIFNSLGTNAQDILYARSCVKTLCSEDYYGRGYVNNGDRLAAQFIRDEFYKSKLIPLGENYFQPLGYPVIFYPDRVTIELDGSLSAPGQEFIMNPGCPSVNGNFKVLYLDSALVDNSSEYAKIKGKNLKSYFLVVDDLKSKKLIHSDRAELILKNGLNAKGLIFAKNKTLVWSPAMEFAPYPILYYKEGSFPALVLKMTIKIDAARKIHSTQNVVGMIKGTKFPDSTIVFTAHYDHLGMMGKDAMFPGANDNASGVAMLLDLAKYYSKNPPAYSVVFIAFAGEEIGLVGSYYFVENPLIGLKNIAMLLNMDLMSTGDEGLTAVNATEFPYLFENLKMCNNIGHYLPDISPRGKAANSDHHYFTEAGVPSFFFYLRGNYHHYHDVDDTYSELTFSKYPEAFQLLRDFANWRMGQ
ncbi:MAG: M28 family peptidase [Bacteroidia bacterium]|nr:M28 family peptidase [Bacteroidia bacterium]MCF8446789.1 M28 family peptidase [Bacteroidia bacterium]